MTAMRRLSVIARSSASYCSWFSCAILFALLGISIELASQAHLIDLHGHEVRRERGDRGGDGVHVVVSRDHHNASAARGAECLAATRAGGSGSFKDGIDERRRDRRVQGSLVLPVLAHQRSDLVNLW